MILIIVTHNINVVFVKYSVYIILTLKCVNVKLELNLTLELENARNAIYMKVTVTLNVQKQLYKTKKFNNVLIKNMILWIF